MASSNQSTLPSIASSLLWLDSWDASTLAACDDRLIQWSRKDETTDALPASAPLYTFGSNLTSTVQSPDERWRSVAISEDGTVVVCMSDDATTRTIISYNGGQSFGALDALNNIAGSTVWSEISMSSDGTVMVVGSLEGGLFVSSNKGLTWNAQMTDTARFWEWTTVSADGQHMLASCYGDYVYASSDSGATWRQLTQFPTDDIDVGFVWVSSSGQQQVIGYYGANLFVSDNYGISFRDTTISGFWYELTAVNTRQLIAYTSPGYIYQSLDGGRTFVPILADAQRDFLAVSVSSNGRTIAAAAANDNIFVSINSGTTWGVLNTGPQDWSAMVMNANGEIFATIAGSNHPIIWRNGTLSTGPDALDVQRSDIQLALAINSSGRTFVVGSQDGTIRVNQPSREPILSSFLGKSCIAFKHASLDVPRPLFGDATTTGFTCILVVRVTATNSAPCLSIGPDHSLLLTTQPNGITLKWGFAPVTASRAMDSEQWAVIAFYVGTTVDPRLAMYLNGSKVLDRVATIAEAPADEPLRIGGSVDGNDDFSGNIGEILIYRGNLQESNLSGWNDAHFYLGRKFAVYAALPQLSGIGSDPHLRQLTGGTFDVSRPGEYTLLRLPGFKMTCHISSIKQGIFMDTLLIVNGDHSAKVTFKSRKIAFKIAAPSALNGYELCEDTSQTIKWDVWPTAPQRYVRVVQGLHPTLGRFWIRLDYKHRYMTPYFASFNNWSTCDGILIGNSKSGLRKVKLVETAPKQIIRAH